MLTGLFSKGVTLLRGTEERENERTDAGKRGNMESEGFKREGSQERAPAVTNPPQLPRFHPSPAANPNLNNSANSSPSKDEREHREREAQEYEAVLFASASDIPLSMSGMLPTPASFVC